MTTKPSPPPPEQPKQCNCGMEPLHPVTVHQQPKQAEPSLLPCPWCGGPAILCDEPQDKRVKNGPRNYWVRCQDSVMIICPTRAATKWRESSEEAIAAWNHRRAPEPPAAAATVSDVCPECKGKGYEDMDLMPCTPCKGTGRVPVSAPVPSATTCPVCLTETFGKGRCYSCGHNVDQPTAAPAPPSGTPTERMTEADHGFVRWCAECGQHQPLSHKHQPVSTPAPSATLNASLEASEQPLTPELIQKAKWALDPRKASTPSSGGIRAKLEAAVIPEYNDIAGPVLPLYAILEDAEALEHELLRWQATVDRLEKERDQAKLMNVKVASRLTIAQGKLFETQQEVERLKAEKEAVEKDADERQKELETHLSQFQQANDKAAKEWHRLNGELATARQEQERLRYDLQGLLDRWTQKGMGMGRRMCVKELLALLPPLTESEQK